MSDESGAFADCHHIVFITFLLLRHCTLNTYQHNCICILSFLLIDSVQTAKVTCNKDQSYTASAMTKSLHHFQSIWCKFTSHCKCRTKLKTKSFCLLRSNHCRGMLLKQENVFLLSLLATKPPENGPEREWKNPQHLGKAMS